MRLCLKHVGHDTGDLLDVVGREGAISDGVGLHAKALHEMRADSVEF